MKKVIDYQPQGDYRLIVISDVHGHYDHLQGLLEKVTLQDQDYLVLLGDFINKGPDSYKTLQMVRKLSNRERTFILKGNHEINIQNVMASLDRFKDVYHLLENEYSENLFHAIFKSSGLSTRDYKSQEDHYHCLLKDYQEDFDFIQKLPIILNFDQFRLVHGGYSEGLCLDTQEREFLKFDDFNSKSKVQDKTTILGHWPACLLKSDHLSNLPYFNSDKNLIFIDGGMGVKSSAELNALVITRTQDAYTYQTIQYNTFEPKTIVATFDHPSEDKIHVNYPHYTFDIIDKGPLTSRCYHHHSQKYFSIFTDLIMEYEGQWVPKLDFVNHYLSPSLGTEVLLCQAFDHYSLVKYKDEFGWVMNQQINV